ncbi:hypothetical protein FRC17_009340 [Serendipita sp. 399]|nr:hypothetical protein FRC17_009340 [Serendipita sp. 399]
MDRRLTAELKQECRKLLSDLDELGHRGPLSVALQDRYNRIIDDHWKSAFSDPLTILPFEICTQIFREVAVLSSPRTNNILFLSTISRNWFHFLISASSLWTRIYISDEAEDNMATVATHLALSGERKIFIFISSPTWRDYMEMLTPHASRIESIEVGEGVDPLQFVKSLGHLPTLHTVLFPDSSDQRADVEEQFFQLMDYAPSLTSVSPFSLTSAMLHHPRAINLVVIRTEVPLSEVVRILSATTRVEPMHLSSLHVSVDAPLEDKKVVVNIDNHSRKSLLPSVDFLQLSRPSPIYFILLEHHFRRIHHLNIRLSTGKELGQLLLALHSSFVRTLTLELLKTVGPLPDRSDYLVLDSLNALTIVAYPTINLGSFVDRIPTVMPSLDLLCARIIRVGAGLHHLGQLRHLRELDVFLDNRVVGALSNNVICFEHLERLTLSTMVLFDLSFLNFRKLESIHVSPPQRNGSNAILPSSYLFPPSSSHTLTFLDISLHPSAAFRLDSLPLLRWLHIEWDMANLWGCDLLKQVIFTPRICPDLRVIRINALLVEWDLVLLMLLRRNFLHDEDHHRGHHQKTVSRIQGMEFGSRVSVISFAWPIPSFLRSKLVPGFHLEEFSLEKVAKVLFETPYR